MALGSAAMAMARGCLPIKLLINRRNHLFYVRTFVFRFFFGFKFCFGGVGVDYFKRRSGIGPLCSFGIPNHNCTSNLVFAFRFGHPEHMPELILMNE